MQDGVKLCDLYNALTDEENSNLALIGKAATEQKRAGVKDVFGPHAKQIARDANALRVKNEAAAANRTQREGGIPVAHELATVDPWCRTRALQALFRAEAAVKKQMDSTNDELLMNHVTGNGHKSMQNLAECIPGFKDSCFMLS